MICQHADHPLQRGHAINYVVIFAGGVGVRMNSRATPKQFLRIHGKTILQHTIEHFDTHPEINGIVVVCVAGWIDRAKKDAAHHKCDKVIDIVPGGATSQESIYQGLKALELAGVPDDGIVLIHDGVRPLVTAEAISANIESVKNKGNAITVAPEWETVARVHDNGRIDDVLERSQTHIAKAPQSFRFRDIFRAHEYARRDRRCDFVDSASLMQAYGHTMHAVLCSPDNIKVTTATDFYMVRAILDARETEQIFG